MNWIIHPWLYQIFHPWHWLTYGQNGLALGLVLTVAVNAFTVLVLYRTLIFVNRQAVAAEIQASAARSAAALAELQLKSAEDQIHLRKRMRTVDASILAGLADRDRWGRDRPMTGAGDVAVRADELAEALSLDVEMVVRRLLRLQTRGRAKSTGGHLGDSTVRWIIVRN